MLDEKYVDFFEELNKFKEKQQKQKEQKQKEREQARMMNQGMDIDR